MADFDLKGYVVDCINKLGKRFSDNPDFLEHESDIHADLYCLLNYENKIFWNKGLVTMGSENNFKGIDLVVESPSKKECIKIEIKFFRSEKSIIVDLKRLMDDSDISGGKILVYFERKEEDINKVKKLLSGIKKRYPEVDIYYLHPEEDKVITI